MAIEYVKMLKNRTFCQIKIAKIEQTIEFKVKIDMKKVTFLNNLNKNTHDLHRHCIGIASLSRTFRLSFVVLMLCLFGVNEKAWGECTLISGGSGSKSNIKSSGVEVYNTGAFTNSDNDAGSISYTCTIGTYTNVGKIRNYGSNVKVEIYYSSGWHLIQTLSYGYDNQNQGKSYTLTGDEKKLTQVRFVTTDGTTLRYDYSISNFKVVREGSLSVSSSSEDMSSVKIDSTATRTFTISAYNLSGTPTASFVSGSDAAFSKSSVTANTGDCPKTWDVTVSYNPTCANTSELEQKKCTLRVTMDGKTKDVVVKATPTLRSQSVSWELGNATSLVAGTSLDVAGFATSTSDIDGKPAIYYTSSDPTVISVASDGHTLVANDKKASYSATITAHQDADCKYGEATADQVFTVTAKDRPEFTLYVGGVATEATSANLKVGDVVEIHYANAPNLQVSGGSSTTFTHSENTTSKIVTVTAQGVCTNGELTLYQSGTAVVEERTVKFTFNISKYVTDLSSLLDVNDFYVGNSVYSATEYNFANNAAYTTNNSEVPVQFSSTDENVINVVNGKIKALKAGKSTVTISQPQNYKWTGDEVEQTIIVKKHAATFGWNVNANYTWNQSISNPFTTDNHDTQITCVSDDTNVADYVDGKVVIYNVTGTAHFTLHQDSSDVWAETSKEYTVNVTKVNKHVPFTINQALYNTLKDDSKSSGDRAWDSGIKIGDNGAGGTLNWNEKYVVIGPFEGVPDKLSCTYSCSDASSGRKWKIFQSADGVKWSSKVVLDESSKGTLTNGELEPSTRYLKFFWSGNYAGYFDNISITERREVRPHETADVNCGTANHGSDPTEVKTILEWYNVKPLTCWITSEHPEAFELVTTSIDSKLDTYKKNQEITIRGKHDVPAGTYTGTLHVSNGIESTTFNLTTTTTKQTPSIVWKNDLSPMSVGDVVADAASAGSATVHYTVDGIYLTLNEQGAVVATNATDENGVDLIAYVAEDETWYAQSETIKVVVTNLLKQTITWNDKLSCKFTGTKEIDLTATASSGLPIKYELSGDGSYAHLNADSSKLVITGIGNTLYLTARSVDNAEYFPAARTKNINSRDPNASCPSEVLYEEYNEQKLATGVTSFGGEWVELTWDAEHPGAEPGLLSCQIKAGFMATGKMAIEEYVNGWRRVGEEDGYDVSLTYMTVSDVAISRNATKVRIGAPTGCTLNHFVDEIKLTQAKYCELSKSQLDFGTVTMGTAPEMSFTVHYSNLAKSLDIELEDEGTQFTVDKTYIGDDCGEHGTVTVTVQYNAANYVENESTNLIISNTEYNKKVSLKALVQKASQTITWNPDLALNTTDVVVFDAVTTDAAAATGIVVTYAVKGTSDVATITSDGHLTILKDGSVTIVASAEGNNQYEDATPVEKTFTISKVTPTITKNPTINAITLPATLNDVAIGLDATAKDDKNNAVTGSFAWQTSSTKVLSDANEYTIVFTPDQPTGKDWYNEVVYNISVTGNKDSQTITWTRADETTQPCSTPTTFDASSNRNLPITYVSDKPEIAYVEKVEDVYHLVVVTSGTVQISATQQGNGDYLAAENVTKTITLTKEQPVIVTPPTADEIFTDNLLNEAGLSGGEGQVNGVHAEGIFAWKNGSIQPELGTHPYTVTFTPSPAEWYYPAECQVDVTVKKHPHSISWSYAGGTIYVDEDDLYFSGATSSVELTNIYYTTSNAEVAEVDAMQGNKLIIHGKGTIDIIARSEGNTNYEAAEQRRQLKILPLTVAVTANPTAEDITYGDALSESELSGGSVKGSDDVVLEGTWAWNDDSEVLNAGQNQSRGVTFTPNDNHWYATATTNATVNVNKADAALNWTNAPTELAYNATGVVYAATSLSDGAITYSITSGSSYAHIDSNTGALTIDLPGHNVTVQAAQTEGTNYNAPAVITVNVAIADAPKSEFTNTTGDGDWNNPDNWTTGVPTDENPNVIVSGALEIDEDVTVGNLTIENTGSIAVITGGTLTVKGTSDYRSEYGDVHVLNDGAIHLSNSADLQVRDFTLDAKLGNGATSAASGQVSGDSTKLHVNSVAYFQLSFDPSGAIDYGWYDFTVPFPVNISGGIERVNSTANKVMVCGQDFLLMEDDEASFVNGGKGWRQISSGVLMPGKLYTITFDETVNQNTFRFAWNGQGELTNGDSFTAQYLTGSDASRNGWNAIGNAMLRHGHIEGDYKIQAYNHTDNVYEIIYDPKTFAVGTAFFIQVEAAVNIDWKAADATPSRPIYAPQRVSRDIEEFRISLRDEATDAVNDVLFFSASEEATEAYVIGHDLLKKGIPTEAKKAQMWATKGGKNLCDVEGHMMNNKASSDLNFFVPKDGLYEIAIECAPEDATLYLTYNGRAIWNLSMSAYEFDLEQGTTEGYGLRIVASEQTTTDIENAGLLNDENGVRKVMIDDVIYIVTPEGKMYDIVGKGIKF